MQFDTEIYQQKSPRGQLQYLGQHFWYQLTLYTEIADGDFLPVQLLQSSLLQ